MEDDAIRSLLKRLGRPEPSGGTLIERSAILASGADFDGIMRWILAHGGEAEAAVAPSTRGGGLHGASRFHDSGGAAPQTPSRYVLPAGALAG
jgi:hypothetical protein